MTEKKLVVAIEGTAAMGAFWKTIYSDYMEKIIRCFCSGELNGQKSPTSSVELSLVIFNARGSYSDFLVQRTGWTRNVDTFLQWLSMIPFSGGGFNDVAIAEGLSEALIMFTPPQNGCQPQLNLEAQMHCILVAASNPYPLPTPVYRPSMKNQEKSENAEAQTESQLSDAETMAKCFAQCAISLSVICPKQLPKLRAIYNAGKRNPRAPDPSVDNVKNPHFLILVSENFMEARVALSRHGATSLPLNQSPAKMEVHSVTSAAGQHTAVSPVNGSIMNRSSISAGCTPPATVKVEPTTVSSMVSGPVFPHHSSVQRPTSQAIPSLQTSSPSSTSVEMIANTETAQDMKPSVSQPLRPAGHVSILNTISQARANAGLQQMGGTHMAMHVSNMISSGISSSVPAAQTVLSSGQSGQPGIQPVPVSGTLTGNAQVLQNSGLGSLSQATSSISGISNLGISQPASNIQGGVSMGQQVPNVSQGNLAGTQMVQSAVSMTQNTMSVSATSGTGAMMPPGVPQQVQSGLQQIGVNNSAGASMQLPQQTSGSLPPAQSKYVKVWEGNLSGQRQGQPVFITRLEGYRSASASETLAANWPATMQIVRLISQDHMNNKQYVGKADFLVFRAVHQHGFLGQLQEKKLCAVIQLPSQTLLLSVSDKACRLIGMLFPGDMVVFKPQISSQQQQLQQQQQQQQQQLQQQHQQQMQLQQQQMQAQQQQQPQMQLQQQQQQQHQQLQHLQQHLPQMQQHPQLQQQQQPQQQIPQLQQPQQLPQLQQQQPQQQIPQLQQPQQLPQLQQQPQQQRSALQQQQLSSLQPQQMVGASLGQSYVQGTGRSQLLSQGQPSSQGQPNMPGAGFMP